LDLCPNDVIKELNNGIGGLDQGVDPVWGKEKKKETPI
jgi:hypothetical protein